MAKAKKLPSGKYRVNQYIGRKPDGSRLYKSFTSDSKHEAEYMAKDYLLNGRRKACELTVDEALQNYIDSKSNTLSEASVRSYYSIKSNCISEIAAIRLCDITEIDLQRWINGNAVKYAPKSLHSQFGLIVSVLKQNKVNIDYSSILIKPLVKPQVNVPDEAAMQKILTIVEGTSIELPVTIALTLGLRQSEIAALHWSDYDGTNINVHRSRVLDKDNKYVERERNKSYNSTRVLPVPALLKLRLDRTEQKGEYISPMLPSSILRKFHSLCEKNGLPKYTMHSQRHANASVMLLNGVPNKYAMARLGQSTPHMLTDVYQHIFTSGEESAAQTVDDAVNSIFNGKKSENAT